MTERSHFFATCAPGLEDVLFDEARALKLDRTERQKGGIAFQGSMRDAWAANLWLRTAIRVLRRVARFEARAPEELYDATRAIAWERFLAPSGTLLVDGRTNLSVLDHSQFLEQVVKDAIVDRFRDATGERPGVDKDDPDLRVNAHVFRDRVTLSVDTSGQSLHRRGWRVHQGEAPLAETTAAAIVMLSGWNGRAPLLDPFCGAGTILIEAARIAGGLAPGALRSFGFERWHDHDARGFAKVREAARSAGALPRKLSLVGSDVDGERIEQARENAASAGVASALELSVADARDFAPRPGWNGAIVTNPPYGQRLGVHDELISLYKDFGRAVRTRCEGYSLTLLTSEPRLRERLGFDRSPTIPITNGGLRCDLLRVERI